MKSIVLFNFAKVPRKESSESESSFEKENKNIWLMEDFLTINLLLKK